MIRTTTFLSRNLGILAPASAPMETFALGRRPRNPEDFQAEIIDFDSEGPEGTEFLAFAPKATGLSKFREIAWPSGFAPRPVKKIPNRSSSALPRADVLIVTWTMDEGHALSRVLTPGFDSRDDWKPYTHKFAQMKKQFVRGCNALKYGRLGTYWVTHIGSKKVVCFKSDSHLSRDGSKTPNFAVWEQLIAEVQPSLVLTTGTGGGIGKRWLVGDVIVSPIVHFDCEKKFKNKPFATGSYRCKAHVPDGRFKTAKNLFRANFAQLPETNGRKPEIAVSLSIATSIVTTDYFGFDNVENSYGLKGKGRLSEMGDAVLGRVAEGMGAECPAWFSVRNVSDPQINEPRKSLHDQAHDASLIYKGYGRWSSVCSAIVCWAMVAGHGAA